MKTQWGKLFGYFVLALVLGAATILIPMVLGDGWLPGDLSTEAKDIDVLFWVLTALSVVIMAVVASIVLYSVVHWRVRPGDLSDGEPIHGHHRIEITWTIIPTIIVAVISVFSYVILVREEAAPAKSAALGPVVDVRGFQFGWGFSYPELQYPGDGYTHAFERKTANYVVRDSQHLVLPLGRTALFRIMSCSGREMAGWCADRYGKPKRAAAPTSSESHRDADDMDVLHAFWVPEARLKADSIPGVPNHTQWTPHKLTYPQDTYQVVCAELCGAGHNAMRSEVCVVPGSTYEWWLKNPALTCVELRLFNCLEDAASHADELADAVATLLKAKPEANCDDLKEQA